MKYIIPVPITISEVYTISYTYNMLLSHVIYAHIKCISYIMCKLYVYTLMGNRHKLDTARGSLSEMTIGYTFVYQLIVCFISTPLHFKHPSYHTYEERYFFLVVILLSNGSIPLFPGSYVPRVPCSPGPMFPASYVPRVLCWGGGGG